MIILGLGIAMNWIQLVLLNMLSTGTSTEEVRIDGFVAIAK